MANERQQNRLELVEALASTIQKKFMEPAGDRMELVNCEIKDLSGRVAELEQKMTLLAKSLCRTRLLAYISLVAATLLAFYQLFSNVR